MTELAEAGVAPAEESSAPVEAAPAEPAPEAAESSDNSLSEAAPSEEATPVSFPSADDFGWDDWKGDENALPEHVRPWGNRFQDYYKEWADGQVSTRTSDVDRMREIYNALLNGESDPRLTDAEGKLSEWENKYSTSQTKYDALNEEYTTYKKGVEEAIQQEADEYTARFKDKNADIFGDETLSNNFIVLLEEGWDLDSAADVVRLPDSVAKVARQAKVDGVPDSYAIRLAQSAKSAPSSPRPGARITSGATTPARSVEQAKLEEKTPMSFKDLRTHVARRALNPKHRR